MTTIDANLQAVHARIYAACFAAHRPVDTVRLVAVSKTWPADCVREAVLCGQRVFAESYVQESLDKIVRLADLDIEWHFIGPLQSNKTRAVAENFAWVHSLDRLKIAERLAAQRPAHLPPLQVCVQVNVSSEASKSGCALAEAPVLAHAIAKLPGLRLRGLMAIPEPTGDSGLQRRRFALLRQLLTQLNTEGLALDTLSMGMSHDLEAAILEGATMVRVGTAIFGARNARPVDNK
ncbi:MAG: YggS family pyridoxal phosphate-dependent enzyme [Rugosibacter sp.]